MPSSFKKDPRNSIWLSPAIFETIKVIGEKHGTSAKEIQKRLKKSQSSIAEMLSLLEKNQIIMAVHPTKNKTREKFYRTNLDGILKLYVDYYFKDAKTEEKEKLLQQMMSNTLFRADFDDFIQQNIREDHVLTFQSLFNYFNLTFARVYSQMLEPFGAINLRIDKISKKSKEKFKDALELWKIIDSVNTYVYQKPYKDTEFPSYEKIKLYSEQVRKETKKDPSSKNKMSPN